jgi:hypothetical protein
MLSGHSSALNCHLLQGRIYSPVQMFNGNSNEVQDPGNGFSLSHWGELRRPKEPCVWSAMRREGSNAVQALE